MASRTSRKPLSETDRAERRQRDRERLKQAAEQLLSSEGWQRWVRVRAQAGLRRLSLSNQLLVAMACPEATFVAGFKAWLAHEKPPEGQLWFAYMLKGGSDASNDDPFATEPPTGKKWVQTGPHVMIGGPGITKMIDSYPAAADETRKPYVMFGGTPYEHLMVPVR